MSIKKAGETGFFLCPSLIKISKRFPPDLNKINIISEFIGVAIYKSIAI